MKEEKGKKKIIMLNMGLIWVWLFPILEQRLRAAPWSKVGIFYNCEVISFVSFALKYWLSNSTSRQS